VPARVSVSGAASRHLARRDGPDRSARALGSRAREAASDERTAVTDERTRATLRRTQCDTRTRFVPAAPYDVATQQQPQQCGQAQPYGQATHVVMMPPQNVVIAEGRPATPTKSYYPSV